MRVFRFASAMALAVSLSGTAATAVTLEQAARPAETPPASYRGDVYVDSRGCAYVRATIGTTVNWVPRLTRDRKAVVCGLTPTASVAGMANARPPAPPAPPPPSALTATAPTTGAAAPLTTATTAPLPLAATAREVAAPATPKASNTISRTMTVTCPAGGQTARVRIGGDTVAVQCSPAQTAAKSVVLRHANGERTRLVVKPPVDPVPAAPVLASTARTVGTGDVVAGGRVIIGGVPPGGATNNFGNGYGVLVTGTAAAPRPGVTTAQAATGGGYVFGNGYGLTDYPGVMDPVPGAGSLGTARVARPNAPGPLPGSGTNSFGSGYNLAPVPSAPRVIIPEGYRPAWEDGRLNPDRGPRSIYGDQQMAATVTVGEVPMRTLNPAPAQGLILQPQTGLEAIFSSKAPATTAAPVTTASAAAPAKRYVQVGMFNVPANAERAAAKLQGLGLPGRIARTASGKTVVIAGPYESVAALNAAIAAARRGFPDAFARN